MLKSCSKFIEVNSQNPPSPVQHQMGDKIMTIYDPMQIGALDIDNKDISTTLKVLDSYQKVVVE